MQVSLRGYQLRLKPAYERLHSSWDHGLPKSELPVAEARTIRQTIESDVGAFACSPAYQRFLGFVAEQLHQHTPSKCWNMLRRKETVELYGSTQHKSPVELALTAYLGAEKPAMPPPHWDALHGHLARVARLVHGSQVVDFLEFYEHAVSRFSDAVPLERWQRAAFLSAQLLSEQRHTSVAALAVFDALIREPLSDDERVAAIANKEPLLAKADSEARILRTGEHVGLWLNVEDHAKRLASLAELTRVAADSYAAAPVAAFAWRHMGFKDGERDALLVDVARSSLCADGFAPSFLVGHHYGDDVPQGLLDVLAASDAKPFHSERAIDAVLRMVRPSALRRDAKNDRYQAAMGPVAERIAKSVRGRSALSYMYTQALEHHRPTRRDDIAIQRFRAPILAQLAKEPFEVVADVAARCTVMSVLDDSGHVHYETYDLDRELMEIAVRAAKRGDGERAHALLRTLEKPMNRQHSTEYKDWSKRLIARTCLFVD